MSEKTEFQDQCSKQLLDKLQAIGRSAEKWDFVIGDKDSYFEGDIGPVHVLIQEDSASIKKDKESKSFEYLNYPSDDDLIKDFVDNVIAMIA